MAKDTPIKVLLIEDNPTDVRRVQETLRGTPSDHFKIISASTLAQGLEHLAADHVDVVLLDLGLPDSQGLATFRAIHEQASYLPIIVLTVSDDEALGRQTVREGAQDFVTKDLLAPDESKARALIRTIHFAFERKQVERELGSTSSFSQENPNPVLRIKSTGELLYANTASNVFLSTWGIQHGEHVPVTWSAPIAKALVRGEVTTLETTATGRTFLFSIVPFKKDSCVNAYGIDITERVRAEKTANEHARRADALSRIILRGNQTSDLAGAATTMLDGAIDLIRFDGGLLYLRNDAEGVAELQAWRHAPDELVAQARRVPLTLPNLVPVYRGEAWFSEAYGDEGSPEHRNVMNGVQATAVAPLVAGDKVIGHFGVWSKRPHHFIQEERALFETIGREAGTVIARMQAEKTAQRYAHQQAVVNRVITSGNQAVNLRAACAAMLEAAMELMQVTHGSIYLLNEPDAMIELQYARGFNQAVLDASRRFPLTTSFYPQVYAGTAMFLNDYQRQGTEQFRVLLPELHTVAIIPLVAEKRVIGNYVVGSSRTSEFTNEEQALLVAIGQQAGTVVARLQAEEALVETEARYRRLIEKSFDAVLIHSAGVIRLANQAAARILKATSPRALIGMNILDLPAPRYRELAKERISAVYETSQSSQPAEFQYCALDGTTVDVEAMATPITYQGSPALYVVFRDIGERKQMEAQLKQYSDHLEDLVAERTAQLAQSEEYFRTLFEESAIAQIRYDAAGHPIRINKAAAAFLGIRDAADIEHLSIWSSPRVSEQDKARLCAGEPIQYERVYDFRAIREDDQFPTIRSDVRYVDFYLLPLFSASDSGVEGYLGQLVDVTERREAEEALKNAERLAAIGQTATMIGHDLRNPLQAVQLTVDLGRKYYDAIPPELKTRFDSVQAERLFSSVEQQILYMDKIVADLQDYARPLQLEPEEVHITAFVTDTLALLTIPESITVHVDIPGSVTAAVDAHLMQRALANLILNALQAMPDGGMLTISAAAEDGSVAISVHDTGVGVPAAMRDKVFSPLTTGKAKGTGLGLAVVKRIVEAHGGTIEFESLEGRGTTFTVTLPQTADA